MTFLEILEMTMELIGERGEMTFNNLGWKQLIDLALRYGWKPAGAVVEERREDDACEVAVPASAVAENEPAKRPAASDEAFAQAIGSVCFRSDDPVLDSYFNNAGYRVTAADAYFLGQALERALPDVPDHDALAHKVVKPAGAPNERFIPSGTPLNPFEWFSGPNKTRLRKLIALCQQGGFEIW